MTAAQSTPPRMREDVIATRSTLPRSSRSSSVMPVALPGGIAWVWTAWRSMSSTRASICSRVSNWIPSGADAPAWHGAQRSAITGWICSKATGVVTVELESSGWSQNASATTPTAATAGIHHARRPACQRLKKTRMRAVSTAIATKTSQASSAPNTNAKWPASIVKSTGSVR